jgi:hypothetical protein
MKHLGWRPKGGSFPPETLRKPPHPNTMKEQNRNQKLGSQSFSTIKKTGHRRLEKSAKQSKSTPIQKLPLVLPDR